MTNLTGIKTVVNQFWTAPWLAIYILCLAELGLRFGALTHDSACIHQNQTHFWYWSWLGFINKIINMGFYSAECLKNKLNLWWSLQVLPHWTLPLDRNAMGWHHADRRPQLPVAVGHCICSGPLCSAPGSVGTHRRVGGMMMMSAQ